MANSVQGLFFYLQDTSYRATIPQLSRHAPYGALVPWCCARIDQAAVTTLEGLDATVAMAMPW